MLYIQPIPKSEIFIGSCAFQRSPSKPTTTRWWKLSYVASKNATASNHVFLLSLNIFAIELSSLNKCSLIWTLRTTLEFRKLRLMSKVVCTSLSHKIIIKWAKSLACIQKGPYSSWLIFLGIEEVPPLMRKPQSWMALLMLGEGNSSRSRLCHYNSGLQPLEYLMHFAKLHLSLQDINNFVNIFTSSNYPGILWCSLFKWISF